MTPFRSPSLQAIDWQPALRAIASSDRVVLTTHMRPDTDGIGSEIALARGLSRLGKDVRVLNPDAADERLRFLDPDGVVEIYGPADRELVETAMLIVVDVSERDRLGALGPAVARARGESLCIDHHVNERRRFAKLNVIEPRAPSTGVLVAELLDELGAPIDSVMAQALYATIIADTGSFRFSNTTSDVLRLAADYIDMGVSPPVVHRAILGDYSEAKIRLLGRTLNGTERACDGRLAWFAVSNEMLREARANVHDAEGLVEYLRIGERVKAAILLVELSVGRVKISFRSEEGFNVNELAASWGGGGHRHASGAVLEGDLDEIVKTVVARAKSQLFAEPG